MSRLNELNELIRLTEASNKYKNMERGERFALVTDAVKKLHMTLMHHFEGQDDDSEVFFDIPSQWEDKLRSGQNDGANVGMIGGGDAVPEVWIIIQGTFTSYEPYELLFQTADHKSKSKFYLQADGTFGSLKPAERVKRFNEGSYEELKASDVEEAVIELWKKGLPEKREPLDPFMFR